MEISKKEQTNLKILIRKFCIRRLHSDGITSFDGKKLSDTANTKLYNFYNEKYGTDLVVDYMTVRHERKKEKHELKENFEEGDYVYFFVNSEYYFCKIGYSKNPFKRLKRIQTGCPFKLWILHIEEGTMENEKEYHERFKKYNTFGEWFKIYGGFKDYLSARFNFF